MCFFRRENFWLKLSPLRRKKFVWSENLDVVVVVIVVDVIVVDVVGNCGEAVGLLSHIKQVHEYKEIR